jgi:hypothetical protein
MFAARLAAVEKMADERRRRLDADERRRRLDADEAWFCLHDDCLCCAWAHATEWALACHMRAEHGEPGPIPVPMGVLAAHLLPRLDLRQVARLARVDRWSRELVRDAWPERALGWFAGWVAWGLRTSPNAWRLGSAQWVERAAGRAVCCTDEQTGWVCCWDGRRRPTCLVS